MVLVHSTTTRDFIMTWPQSKAMIAHYQMHWEYNLFLLTKHVLISWNEHDIVVLLTVLPFCLCLRPHPHCGECDGGDGGGWRLGEGGEWTWCPRLQATGNQAAVNLWEREESFTWKVLGQYRARCLLGGAGSCHLHAQREDSSCDGETILAKRYVHFLITWNWTSVLWCLHSNDAHQYTLAYLCSNCILHTWILYLSVHVPIVTHDHNHIMVAMQETWFTTTHL